MGSKVCQNVFNALLHDITGSSQPRRLGLAISGGVDSMALAALCSNSDIGSERCVAFIVDHGLRACSTDESLSAKQVLEEQLNIEARVLKLDLAPQVFKLGDSYGRMGIETLARRARYRALGVACRDMNINALLVAHHSDDVAETILVRIKNQYLGLGLSGIAPRRSIPECHDIYGVGPLGNPRAATKTHLPDTSAARLEIESGGVMVHRPLLRWDKKALMATCRHYGISWFEDATNTDKKLTPRNTIRSLLDHGRMPLALSTPKLLELGQRIRDRMDEDRGAVDEAWRAMSVKFDARAGCVGVSMASDMASRLNSELDDDDDQRSKSRLYDIVRKMLSLVSPQPYVESRSINTVIKTIFFPSESPPAVIQTTGGMCTCKVSHGVLETVVHVCRQQPTPHELTDRRIHFDAAMLVPISDESHAWTDWQCFDNRYWIRLRVNKAHIARKFRYAVTFFTPELLLAAKRAEWTRSKQLTALLAHMAPGAIRWTLPAIVQTSSGSSEVNPADILLALPSLSHSTRDACKWARERDSDTAQMLYDIRYRHVDLESSALHELTG